MTTEDRLTLKIVPLSKALQWDWSANPKEHDIGGIAESIRRYGFRSPPELDATLGAFAQGSGRVQALAALHRQNPDEPPRYIPILETGEWGVPILFGADSESEHLAMAYAIDANNLVLTGGDTEIWDLLALYDKEQMKEITTLLMENDQGLVSLDTDALSYAGRLEDEAPPEVSGEEVAWTFEVSFTDSAMLRAELESLLGPWFMPRSKRRIIPEFFIQMVRAYCGQLERPALLA